MRYRFSYASLVAMSLATGATGATLDTVSTSPTPPGEIWGIGEGANETMGQTFTVPAADTFLTSFTFLLADEDFKLYDAYGYTGVSTFDFFVMKWNGATAVGPVLFQSGPVTVIGGNYTPTAHTVNTGYLPVIAGQQYVAFLSASTRMNGTNDFANMAYAGYPYAGGGDAYAGGGLVWLDNGSDTGKFTTDAWTKQRTEYGVPMDAAFRAVFTNVVPEPTILGLIGIGLPWVLRRQRVA